MIPTGHSTGRRGLLHVEYRSVCDYTSFQIEQLLHLSCAVFHDNETYAVRLSECFCDKLMASVRYAFIPYLN